jgi:hypothetical protein
MRRNVTWPFRANKARLPDRKPRHRIVSLPRKQRHVMAVAAVLIVGLALLVLLGPSRLRPWQCRNSTAASTPDQALRGYYASCLARPQVVNRTRSPTPSGNGVSAIEYTVEYSDHRTRFVIVEQRPDGRWEVKGSEGTGP